MPFNSLEYLIFLPVVYLLFFLVADRARWCVLLAASLLFYAALNVPYLLVVLVVVAVTTFGFGILIYEVESSKAKLYLLWGGVAANLVILCVMKYMPFFSENLKPLSLLFFPNVHMPPVKVLVAIGVSYYAFQAISYLLDIYLEVDKPERNFGYFALYLSFFPKLLQGPLERAGDLLPQLKIKYEFNYDNMRDGMLLLTWGLFKKVVIADRLGLYVDQVYNNVHAFTGLPLLLATYAYAFQIYMDFSGYTDIALGSALLFNIKLTQNFNSPYLATSVPEFWRRWHISFSNWILDYVFKPFQMQLRNWKTFGTATALVIAFLISGIWHGASWGFIIWGGLHGLFMACSVLYKPYQKKLHKALGIGSGRFLKVWQVFFTFHLVNFAWVFFRANKLEDAYYILSSSLVAASYNSISLSVSSFGQKDLLVLFISASVIIVRHTLEPNKRVMLFWERYWIARWFTYNFLILLLGFYVKTQAKFIYFNF